MGEPGREEYKIQSFDAETQQLLKTALKGEQHAHDGPGEPRL
uniref:MIF4G domain containing n=2 Tax=Felidae TaxID=9681 RepID=A0ABI8AKG9_FELCA